MTLRATDAMLRSLHAHRVLSRDFTAADDEEAAALADHEITV
jgi:hypothetical protein